jgi:anti-anti-sigma regulatory factor
MSSVSANQPAPDNGAGETIERASLVVAVNASADRAVIHADGELDKAGGEVLRRAVAGLAAELPRVELNLSGVTAADLAGVRALDAVRAAIEAAGAELTIHHADRIVYPIDWHSVPHSTTFATIDERQE